MSDIIPADIDRLLSQLNKTGLQQKDNNLYQVIKQLIGLLAQLNKVGGASITTISGSGSKIANNTIIPGVDGLDGEDALIIPGPRGLDGKTIPIPGNDGEDGSDGFSIKGDRGIDGIIGVNGVSGNTILPEDGIDGQDGFPGIKGTDGVAGATGPAGPAGLPGIDASEPDVFMIPGSTGPIGPTGAIGPAGIAFLIDEGIQGEDGVPGAAGPTGASSATPDIATTVTAPAIDENLATTLSAIVERKFTIASGKKLTINSGARFRIH